MRSLTILLAAAPCLHLVLCLHNVTVDDQDPSIVYNPRSSWTLSANSSLDYGGAHMLTQDPTATATFTFTGVAVYFMSPLWPYVVNTAVSVDSGPSTLIDLQDHSRSNAGQGSETVQSAVVWGSGQLNNTQHTLVISVGAGQSYAVVDALVYTVVDPGDTTTTTTSASSASSISSTSSSGTQTISSTSSSHSITATGSTTTVKSAPAPQSHYILPITIGSVLGALALLLIVSGFWFLYRRRRTPTTETTVPGKTYAPMAGRPVTGEYAYAGVSQRPHDSTWEPARGYGPIPGAMAPQSMSHPYASATPVDDWQGTTAQIAQRYMRSPNRYLPYEPNTLSTITEATTPRTSPLIQTPGSIPEDLANDVPGPSEVPENRAPPFPVLTVNTRPPAYNY
ncbi:hypothetical protein H0H92_000017 [Tricholoma furcatifolium]|nr:hypothetical protein H0H92_000017 [Tricholoma furcatifolium]